MAELPIMYTRPSCVQCNASERWLRDRGFTEGADYIKQVAGADEAMKLAELGYFQAPVFYFSDEDHFGGFDPDELAAHFVKD